jgi:TolB-like protein
MGVWAELRRRNVFRVAGVYVVVAWLVAQAANVLSDMLPLPEWFGSVVIVLLVLGFPIVLVIAWAFELTPEGVRPSAPAAAGTAVAAPSPASRVDYVIAAALVGVLALSLFGTVRGGDRAVAVVASTEPVPPAVPAPPSVAPEPEVARLSVAVLPFADMSPERDQEYFADGLSEELMNVLAQIDGLLVTGRTSSFVYKNHNEDLRVIGETLGVAHILEGSVRKSGDRVRITAQLISASDGYHLWSQTYDRDLTDIFAVQDEVAMAVADALSATLGMVVDEDPFAPRTDDLEAYDLFLRAGEQMNIGGRGNYTRAVSLYREAFARDPEFLAALAGLARALRASSQFDNERAQDLIRERSEVVARLIAEAPEGWQGHALRADQLLNQNDLLGARRSLDAAREHAPPAARAEIDDTLLFLSVRTGRYTGTLDFARARVRADPLSIGASLTLQWVLYALGMVEEAEAEYERSKDLQGNRTTLEALAMMRAAQEGMGREVVGERYARVMAANPAALVSGAFNVFEVFDDREAALAGLRNELTRVPSNTAMNPISIAWWADYYGDADLAAEALRVRVALQGVVGWGLWDPVYKHVRSHPGFKELVREYGYYDYWRATGEWSDYCRPVGDDDFECS